MSKTVQDILSMIAENGIQMVDFKMVDINGAYRHVSIQSDMSFHSFHDKRHKVLKYLNYAYRQPQS